MKNIETLAIIPARGGSKGLIKKNIRKLAGNPMIHYSIKAALNAEYVDRVIVSTEDNEIKSISENYSVEVIERPESLADDDSDVIDSVLYCLDYLQKNGYHPNLIVLLQPTSPLRQSKDIDEAIQTFLKGKYDSLVSVTEIEHPIQWSQKIVNGFLSPAFENYKSGKRRQEIPKCYLPNGAIYISSIKNIKHNKTFYGKKIAPYIMPPERSIDIDNMIDFNFAEFLLIKKNGKKDI